MKKVLLLSGSLLLLATLLSAQEVLRLHNGATLTIRSGALVTLAGSVTLEDSSHLSNSGMITLLQSDSSMAANWLDLSTKVYSYGTGSFGINGKGIQVINSKDSFGTVAVNTAGIQLGSDIISANWLLTKGIIHTGNFTAIAASTTAAAVSADSSNNGFFNGWFDGRLRRYVVPAAAAGYDFPVGNADGAHPALLTAHSMKNVHFLDMSFGPRRGTDAGLVVKEDGTPYTMVNDGGVWFLTPDGDPRRVTADAALTPGGAPLSAASTPDADLSAGKYDLRLSIAGISGLADNEFAILQRPDSSADARDWQVPYGSSLPAKDSLGRTVAGGFAIRNRLSSFGQMGIGMTNPLPTTIDRFDVKRLTRLLVALDWETSTELGNKGFSVERRFDKDSLFSAVAFVGSEAPHGDSKTPLAYYYADINSYSGVSYYRLRQEGLDGSATLSMIRAVSGIGGQQVSITLFPNPNRGQFTLRVDGSDASYRAIITDLTGRTVRSIDFKGGNNVLVSGLNPGLYFVQIPDVFGKGVPFIQSVLVIR